MEDYSLLLAKKLGYKGTKSSEAKNWINAVNKGMDMSDEARFARAKEIGFDSNTIFYHGTANSFDEFDRSRVGENYLDSGDTGFFFTKKRLSAENYAMCHSKDDGDGIVLEVFLKYFKSVKRSVNSDYLYPADDFDMHSHDLLQELRLENCDAIYIKGTKNDDMCVVFDPNQILSIHAAFDPETESRYYKTEYEIEEEELCRELDISPIIDTRYKEEPLSFVLDDLNSERILKLTGEKEKEKKQGNFIIRETSNTGRVVLTNGSETPIAGMRFVKMNGKNIVSDIYTHPDYRRNKAMDRLYEFTKNKFGDLTHSEHLTEDGKAFVNYFSNKDKNKEKRLYNEKSRKLKI